MTISAGLTGVFIVLGVFLALAFLGLWPVIFRRQPGPGVPLGCAMLAVGGVLFSIMVMMGLSVAYVSHSERHAPPPAAAARPLLDRPVPIDEQPPSARVGRAGASGQSSAPKQREEPSLLPSPADQPPVLGQLDPSPTEPAADQQGQGGTPAKSDAKPNAGNGDTRKSPAAGERGAVAGSGGASKAESKTAGDDVNAESADLLSRAMARGIKAAMDFLAKEGALEKNTAQEDRPHTPAAASNQQATAAPQSGERPGKASAGPASSGASGEAATSTANTSAPSTAGDQTKSAPPRQRPAWVDMPLERTSDGHRMALKVGPCFSGDECRRSLPEELEKATNQFARQCLHLDAAGGIHIDPQVLQDTLVRETWEETIETSVGPTVWLYALVEFDRRACNVIKEAHRRMVVERRLKSVAAILGCTLLLLGVVYTGLRTDERLAGRFRLLTIAVCLVAAGAVSVGAIGVLGQIAHGG